MGQHIDQFRATLRRKLAEIDTGFESLDARMKGRAEDTELVIRAHIDKLQARIDQDRGKASAAGVRVKDWLEARKALTMDEITDWKARHETHKLQRRADRAEQYAADAIDIALAAIDEAGRAALEALLAREEAEGAVVKDTARAAS